MNDRGWKPQRTTGAGKVGTAALMLVLLAACGGADAPRSAATTNAAITAPAAAVTDLRRQAHAMAAAAVAPAEAARQLMDFAEARYPQYFPGHPATQSLSPFAYRFYPSTGTYLGVVVSEGGGYEYLGVYVMGGSFGSAPLFVGPLASFITAVAPGGGTSNGCYDQALSLAEVAGTRTVVVWQGASLPGGFITTDFTAIGPAVFEGRDTFETLHRQAGGSSPAGLADGDGVITVRMFDKKTGPAEITQYGTTSSMTQSQTVAGTTITTDSTSKSVSDPPWVEKTYSVPLGASATMTSTTRSTTTTTTTFTGKPPSTQQSTTSTPRTLTVTFVRREPVTVPIGTFNACVFDMTDGTPGSLTTAWVADGRGLPLKVTSTYAGTTATQVAHSIRLNGAAVTP